MHPPCNRHAPAMHPPCTRQVLKAEKHNSETAVIGIKREIMLLSLIAHPNIISVLATGQHDNQPFVVVDRLPHILSSILPAAADAVPVWVRRREKRRWPLARGLRYGRQLALALAHCHDTAFPGFRVLHRDVKPKNIGVTSDDTLVLFDFGLASVWRIDVQAGCEESRPLTGQTGSLRYMAPEVALSRPYSHKAEGESVANRGTRPRRALRARKPATLPPATRDPPARQ